MVQDKQPYYCARCSWRKQRASTSSRNNTPKRSRLSALTSSFSSSSSSCSSSSNSILRTRTKLLFATILLLNALTPFVIQAQVASQPSVYTPRHSAASAKTDNFLYIISGTVTLPAGATADILALPLDQAFPTTLIPWQKLQAGYFIQEAQATTSLNKDYIVVTGASDQLSQLVVVYNIAFNTWGYLNSSAVADATPQTPRTKVAITLDRDSNVMVVYGGLVSASSTFSTSTELDILDTHSSFNQWTWPTAISNAQPIPGLVQPIVLYIPTLKATLIMGGCNTISPSNGSIIQCAPFTTGYLVDTTQTPGIGASVPISKFSMYGVPPLPRLAPCTVVMESGNVFMHGGATSNGSLSDAWLLNTTSWTWTALVINGLPVGRAGAACELVTPDQIIMVGGYDGGLTGPQQFSQPQFAILNTTSWLWLNNFTPAPNSKNNPPSPGIPIGAIIGIAFVACILTGILGFVVGRVLWQRWNFKNGRGDNLFRFLRPSHSNELLVDGSRADNPPSPITEFGSASCTSIVSSSMNSDAGTRTLYNSRDREPFLIIPYAPDLLSTSTNNSVTLNSSNFSDTSTRANAYEMASIHSDRRSRTKKMSESRTGEPEIVKGSRLPLDLADIQQGHYVKTIQFQKQFERHREQLSSDNSIQRMGTQDSLFGSSHAGRGGVGSAGTGAVDDDGVYFATGVIDLRDIDFGEEPISGSWDPIEDGNILLSSHIDNSHLENIN
ncbi:hypothetical protein BGZ80_002375 [Entomortierella chlamydospora]|uniref:Galactose oxidase n=1 Tax=Entomortierella chlamydospora TaxID=101097 RepID=A0A9P6MQB6_9FUNG|nr:hypothetical protein BGZ79_003477 [Entomortierella chlamydospora]KAG0009454.1 hypothetical protein BGZ80_002375 [Entomortierella chlamydospora]